MRQAGGTADAARFACHTLDKVFLQNAFGGFEQGGAAFADAVAGDRLVAEVPQPIQALLLERLLANRLMK